MRIPAIHDLFVRYRREIARFLMRRVRSPDIAADLTQDAFLRLLQVASAVEIRDTRAYLFRTAANLATDYHRTQRSQPLADLSDAAWGTLADQAPSPERAAAAREELRLLQAELGRLSPRAREVLVLARLEGLTYREIGARLGISPKTAFTHLVNALVRLSQGLHKK